MAHPGLSMILSLLPTGDVNAPCSFEFGYGAGYSPDRRQAQEA